MTSHIMLKISEEISFFLRTEKNNLLDKRSLSLGSVTFIINLCEKMIFFRSALKINDVLCS
jgi:hypothetical protein